MKRYETTQSKQDDLALNDQIPDSLDDAGSSANEEIRKARLLQLQAESLVVEDSLESCLGSINCGLIEIENELEQRIRSSLAEGPKTMESIEAIKQPLDAYLRIVKQIDRLSLVMVRSREAWTRSGATATKKTLALQKCIGDVERRNQNSIPTGW